MDILPQHADKIKGILHCYDRILFKGYMSVFYRKQNFEYFLHRKKILKKDFPTYTESLTKKIKASVLKAAQDAGTFYRFLPSLKTSKEQVALETMKEKKITDGLICILGSVENCRCFSTQKNLQTGKLEIVNQDRKCTFFYFYYIDEEFGFMHVRLQSWFPFTIQIYINGREYLARQFDKEGVSYLRYDNSFLKISDISRAQDIADKLEKRKWARTLDIFADRVNPVLSELTEVFSREYGYHFSLWQCEYATDVMFKSRAQLQSVYPDWVEHAILCFNCEDVMTFLGRKLNSNFLGELVSDMKRRPQGIRVKHRMKKNFIKMYDKCSVLRIETIINDPKEFKIYREVQRKGELTKAWVPMGKSVANMYRYGQTSKAANLRYLNALSSVEKSSELQMKVESVCKPVERKGKRFSAFNLLSSETCQLFLQIMDGSNNINGFSNKTIRKALFPESETDPIQKRRNAGRVTRLLAKLRAHKLIAKIPRTFRYKVSNRGIQLMAAVLKIKRKELPALIRAG